MSSPSPAVLLPLHGHVLHEIHKPHAYLDLSLPRSLQWNFNLNPDPPHGGLSLSPSPSPSLSLLATNPLQPPASPFRSEGGLFIYLREGNRGYGIALRFCNSFIRIVREGNYKSNPAGANPFRNFRLERPRRHVM